MERNPHDTIRRLTKVTAPYPSGYYVDAVNGDDTRTGRSPASAWKTISKVNGFAFIAGDRIYLTGEFPETLTVPASNLTFASYGTSGATLTGADSITGFSNGGSNIWDKGSITTQPLGVIVGANPPQAMAASRAACIAPGNWFWAANTLSVYATSDPSGTVKAGQRNKVIDTNNKNSLIFNGLTVTGNNALHSTGAGIWALNNPTSIVINNCRLSNNAGCGIVIGGTADSFFIQNCTFTYNGENGIYNNNVNSTNEYILYNIISDNGWAAGASNGFGSGYQGEIQTGEIAYNVIANNGAAGPAGTQHGIYLGQQANGAVLVHHNTITNHTQGAGVKTRQGATIYNNAIDGGRNGISLGDNGANAVTYLVYNNVISNPSQPCITEGTAGAGATTCKLYHNTLYNGGGNGSGSLQINMDNALLDVRNNLIAICTGLRIMWLEVAQTGTVTIDYNLYYQPSDATPFRNISTEMNFVTWQGLSYDAHGINADPLLVSSSDFHLQAGSPCIGAGDATVGILTDYDGVLRGAAVDIGAYEKV